jgi:hypothetical protein
MTELVASFANLIVVVENAVHGAQRAEPLALVEQRGVYLGRRQVHEAWLVEHRQNLLALLGWQGTRLWRAGLLAFGRCGLRVHSPVVRRTREPEGEASWRNPDLAAGSHHRIHHDLSLASGVPSKAATFF